MNIGIQMRSWSKCWAWVIGSIAMSVLPACGSTVQAEKKMTDKDQILDLIFRAIQVARSGVLEDQASALDKLRVQKIPHTFRQSTAIPYTGHRFITNVTALDAVEREADIGFRVATAINSVIFSIRNLHKVACIAPSDIEFRFPFPPNHNAPPHGQKGWSMSYSYQELASERPLTISFDYWQASESAICLDSFAIRYALPTIQ